MTTGTQTSTGLNRSDVQQNDLRDVPNHQGQPRSSEVDLFAPPPPPIGKIKSAESTLKLFRREWSMPMRILLCGLIGAGCALPILWFAQQGRPTDRPIFAGLAAIAGILVALVAWYMTRFKHRCTYVGEDGIAQLNLSGSRDAQPNVRMLLFGDASSMQAPQTRQFVNGIYTGTDYDYRWFDEQGNKLYRLNGRYVGKDKPPKPGSPFHFAWAAEIAWSQHILARYMHQLETEGSMAFPVDKKRLVRVGQGFLEFHFGEEPVRVTREEIASVTLGGGMFSFKHKDAKWYRSAGKYSFQYGRMANGKVFLLALDKLMGYRWK